MFFWCSVVVVRFVNIVVRLFEVKEMLDLCRVVWDKLCVLDVNWLLRGVVFCKLVLIGVKFVVFWNVVVNILGVVIFFKRCEVWVLIFDDDRLCIIGGWLVIVWWCEECILVNLLEVVVELVKVVVVFILFVIENWFKSLEFLFFVKFKMKWKINCFKGVR